MFFNFPKKKILCNTGDNNERFKVWIYILFRYDLFEGSIFVNKQGGLFGVDNVSWIDLVGSLIQDCIALILFVHVMYRALYRTVSKTKTCILGG